jgi:uncharacterized GH25 family protein
MLTPAKKAQCSGDIAMMLRIVGGIVVGLSVAAAFAGEQPRPLTGRVVDEKEQPLAGAKVTAFELVGADGKAKQKRELTSVVTGADGRFRFDPAIAQKSMLVLATKEQKYIGGLSPRATQSGEVTIRLVPAAPLDGVIVDDAGKPVAGANVGLSVHELEWLLPFAAMNTKTDAQGRFSFRDLPAAATLELDMSAPGYARSLAEGPFAPRQKGLRFVMPPEGRLEGTVVEKGTGKPVPNARLEATGNISSGSHYAYAVTDKTGHFLMSGLSGGKYKIKTVGSSADDESVPPEWTVATANEETEAVEVNVGSLTSGVRVEAVQAALVEIVLTDAATGNRLKDKCTIIDISPVEDLRIRHSGSLGKDGTFHFSVLPGKYVVTCVVSEACFWDWGRPKSDPFRVEVGKPNRVSVAVKETGLRVPPRAQSACIGGIVCDTEGKLVAKAKIRVLPLFGNSKDMVAGDDGRFSIPAADIGPICCFVWIHHPAKDLVAIGTGTLIDRDPEEQKQQEDLAKFGNIYIGATPRKIRLRPPAILSGVVRDPQGNPIAGAAVTAQVDASHMGHSAAFTATQTDNNGRYRLALDPITATDCYVVSANAPGYTEASKDVTSKQLLLHREPSEDIVLHPNNRTVRGVVQDLQGRPVPGAVLTAKRMDKHAYPGCVVSDAQGRFVIEHLDDADEIHLFAHVPGRGWVDYASTIGPGAKEVVVSVGPHYY